MNQPQQESDWATYKRLLGYVAPYWHILLLSVTAFLIAAGAEAYFGKLFGQLIEEWDDTAARTAAMVPVVMGGVALIRAIGAILGETLIARVSFNVVYNLREQLFDQLVRLPSAYYDASSQGHIVSRITFTVAQLRDTGHVVLSLSYTQLEAFAGNMLELVNAYLAHRS